MSNPDWVTTETVTEAEWMRRVSAESARIIAEIVERRREALKRLAQR